MKLKSGRWPLVVVVVVVVVLLFLLLLFLWLLLMLLLLLLLHIQRCTTLDSPIDEKADPLFGINDNEDLPPGENKSLVIKKDLCYTFLPM